MVARPLVTVQKKGSLLPLPKVFLTPIRYDLIQFVHTNMSLNKRHPYAVTRKAGHKYSAESWGTGRAVARIPRVSGGGTSRSGQGAFGNMCRGGRMFAPTKVFRKWTRKVNQKIRRFAVRAALAASAIPALVMARGHDLQQVPEVPLVVPNTVENLEKTKDAVKLLNEVGLNNDLQKVKFTRRVRPGKGKRRNHRYRTRKAPLLIVSKPCKAMKAFRNILGFDILPVRHLNLLKLAPGGHCGRMIVWTEDAFKALDRIYRETPPHAVDSKRVINSEEVQGVIRKKRPQQRKIRKNLPRPELNPAAKIERKREKKLRRVAEAFNKDRKAVKARRKARVEKTNKWKNRIRGLYKTKDGKIEKKKYNKKAVEARKARNAKAFAEAVAAQKARKEAGNAKHLARKKNKEAKKSKAKKGAAPAKPAPKK